MPADKDTALGRLAVERGYLTQAQLDEATALRQKMHDEFGMDQSLEHVLVGKHLLSQDQAQELRHAVAIQTGEARLVAGYEVISKLGQGGMGAVYKAKHRTSGQFVALKILPPSLATDELVKRFRREAEVVRKLDHDNIVACTEFGFDKRRKVHFCALELVEGEDLAKRITRLGRLTEDEALSITNQTAMALQHAFFNGLVHRDVKPENIMVTADGTAKLLDLGLARPANQEATRLTESGMFVGSPYYASPEQAMGEREIDTRADIYSLGATLYHMVTGKPPFEGTTALAILQKHVNEKLPWPAEVNPDLSDGLCMIIAKMMEKSPEDRYQTPNDLNRDLDLLMEGNEPEVEDAALKNSSVKVPAVRPGRRPAALTRRAKERDRRHREPAERRRRDSARERRREVEPRARGKPSGLSALSTGAKIGIPVVCALVAVGLVAFLTGEEKPDRRPPKPKTPKRQPGTVAKGSTPGPREPGRPPGPRPGPVIPASPAARRLVEMKPVFDPSFADYTEGRKMLRAFLKEFPDAPEAQKAKARLAEITAEETKQAKAAVAKAADHAGTLASRGRFGDARNAFDKAREQFGGNEWFKAEGEEKIASALKGIEKRRLDAATRAVAQAGRLLDAKRFDEADRTLAERAGWPDGVRERAERLAAKIASARTAAEKEEKRIDAWLDCLIGLEKAGKTSLTEARAHLQRGRKRLRELGLAGNKLEKLERIERRLRPAKLVEDIAEIALQRTKGTVRFRWKGETVAAKVVSVEGGVLKLKIIGGKEETIPISEMAAEDVVAHARVMRGSTKDPVKAASYYFLRGELDAARKVIDGLANDAAFALEEDIALVASASRERKMRQEAEAEAARAAAEAESHIGPAPTLTLDLGGGVKMTFVYIRPGTFVMGGDADVDPKRGYRGVVKPKHEVAITKGFYIGKYQVTQSEYGAIMGGNPSKWKGPNRPVERVTWDEAAEFCRLAAERTRRQFRLPTEAEWEYACRAGTTTRFSFGDSEGGLGEYAWYKNSSGGQTHPVGQKKPNAWGLYDTHGNVWEWVADWYDAGYYAKSPREDPAGPKTGVHRLLRGGGWGVSSDVCRSAFRLHLSPPHRGNDMGFRVVVSASPRTSASAQAAYDRAMARAKMRVRLKDWKGAAEACQEALKARPGDAEAKRLLAEAESHIGPAPTLTLDLGRGVTMEFVYIKPGVFMMGDEAGRNDEKPVHEVAITKGFYIGRYEVTRGQFAAFVNSTGHKTEAEREGRGWGRLPDGKWGNVQGTSWRDPKFLTQTEDHPVVCVSWNDAKAFCEWASTRTRGEVRLPTEAEWEYACRAGSATRFCFGDREGALGEYAWHSRNSDWQTHPVGQKRANAWGLHDMHGSVWEWVADWYDGSYYANSSRGNPTGPDAGNRRLLRGGSWNDGGYKCRSALRFHGSPSYRYSHGGFRAVVSASPRVAASERAAYAKAMSRAKIRVRLKNWKGAAEACEEALKLKPGDAEAKKLLAEAESHLGPTKTLILDLGGNVTMEFVYIKPGAFVMGDEAGRKDEKPVHEVAITKGFYIGRYEVTRGQFTAFVKATGHKTEAERAGKAWARYPDGQWRDAPGVTWRDPKFFTQTADHPVICVSWDDAKAFCEWASARTRGEVRLPTEAEWEYACRAGATTRYCFGDSGGGLGEYAWYGANSNMQTHPVGQKRANAWGLHDAHGNVCEWVADYHDSGYYARSPRENPIGPDVGGDRVRRGGSWHSDSDDCRAARRHPNRASSRDANDGFRAAVSLTPPRR